MQLLRLKRAADGVAAGAATPSVKSSENAVRINAISSFPWLRGGPYPRWLLTLLWAVWLPFLAQPVAALFYRHLSEERLAVSLLGVGAFVAVYLRASFDNPVTRDVRLAGEPRKVIGHDGVKRACRAQRALP